MKLQPLENRCRHRSADRVTDTTCAGPHLVKREKVGPLDPNLYPIERVLSTWTDRGLKSGSKGFNPSWQGRSGPVEMKDVDETLPGSRVSPSTAEPASGPYSDRGPRRGSQGRVVSATGESHHFGGLGSRRLDEVGWTGPFRTTTLETDGTVEDTSSDTEITSWGSEVRVLHVHTPGRRVE